jgi:acetyltransferase-like isoleucine patch superfamily enzyme
VRALLGDEADLRTAAQMLARTLAMLVRGGLTNASCAWPPRPVLRGRRVRLLNRHRITIGTWSVLEDDAQIQGRSIDGVHLGDRVSVGSGAQIRPSGFYGRAPGRGLRIGDDSNVGPMNYIGCSELITIGRRCLLGPNVNIFTEWHEFDQPDSPIKAQGVGAEPVVLDDDCWIGAGSIILPGVVVGQGAVVAAGSVVTRDVAPRTLVAGVPAVTKRALD